MKCGVYVMFNTVLPIYTKKNEIVNSVNSSDVTIISAETGSGKSTQVPQYLFEEGYEVIVTQPRRIACISLANRVSVEMNSDVVAYHTAFESTKTEDTKVLFCTDGLQMMKSVSSSSLKKNTVLVIDEVHEWNINVEVLIAWVKNEYKKGKKIKVVIMSATFDCSALKDYFADVASVSIVDVKNRTFDVTWHKVSAYSLNDVVCDEILKGRNVLVFQPGKKEIEGCVESLKDRIGDVAEIMQLHGELSAGMQNRCFEHFSIPKVVVATNVAQTSITIDDIDTVVDTGLEKFILTSDGIEGLVYNNISKADCIQRAGRAGRTKVGDYYLCSDVDYDTRSEYLIPEINRLLLDKVVLKLATVGIDANELEFFHQPSKEDIAEAKRVLSVIGAFNKDGTVSDVGFTMSKLPVGSKSARMLIEAADLGVLDDMIVVAAIIENGSLVNFKKVKEGYESTHFCYSDLINTDLAHNSDLIAELLIYKNILNRRYVDFRESGINGRVFSRVKAYVDKLSYCVGNILNNNTDVRYDVTNIVKAMIPAMADNIYAKGYDTFRSFLDDSSYIRSVNSCVGFYDNDICIGFPICVEYKDRYGWMRKKSILQFISAVDGRDIVKYLNEDELRSYYKSEYIKYYVDKDCFVCDESIYYKNYYLYTIDDITVTKDDSVRYKEVRKVYNNSYDNKTYITINGTSYRVYRSFSYMSLHVTDNDMLSFYDNGIVEIKDNNDVNIRFDTNRGIFRDVNLWYNQYVSDILEAKKQFIERSFPSKTGKLETIMSWFSDLGKMSVEFNNKSVSFYVGLERIQGSIKMKAFSSESESNESTVECLKYLINDLVVRKYNDKNFKVKNYEGKKVENAKTEACKYEFHDNVRMALEEVTLESFSDTLEYIDEVYNMCISDMGA